MQLRLQMNLLLMQKLTLQLLSYPLLRLKLMPLLQSYLLLMQKLTLQ